MNLEEANNGGSKEALSIARQRLNNSYNVILKIFYSFIQTNQMNKYQQLIEPFQKMKKLKKQNSFYQQHAKELFEDKTHGALYRKAFIELFNSDYYIKQIKKYPKLRQLSRQLYLNPIKQVWLEELEADQCLAKFTREANAQKVVPYITDYFNKQKAETPPNQEMPENEQNQNNNNDQQNQETKTIQEEQESNYNFDIGFELSNHQQSNPIQEHYESAIDFEQVQVRSK